MGNTPVKGKVVNLTNDVISSIKMNFSFQPFETKRGRTVNPDAYRVDSIDILIESQAGIADGDYILADICYTDLNGKALADLKSPDSKDYIERRGKVYQMLGTQGNFAEIDDPAKMPISIVFDHAFCVQDVAYINLLFHGLAATRDTPYEIWGQYVELGDRMHKRIDKSVEF